MAAIRSYSNGAGGSSGADLAVLRPLLHSGQIWYVGNAIGAASDSNDGRERVAPLATLGQAVTNSAAHDLIVLLGSHNETIGTVVTPKAGTSIVGEGSGLTVPRLVNGVGAATNCMLLISAASVMLDNIYFPASSVVARERVEVLGGSGTSILRNLTFECGVNDGQRSLYYVSVGPDYASNLRFTSVSATPAQAIQLSTTTYPTFDNITVDGGSFGWGSNGAIYGSNAPTGLRWTRMYLLNGSNILLPTGTSGIIQVAANTGGSIVDWTA